MARHSVSAFYLVGLFLLCYCVLVKARRYGSAAKTLHMPPLTEAKKLGEKFAVMYAEDRSENLSDDVDKLLHRFRRTATRNGDGIEQTTAPLNDSHSMLIVHWAGEESKVIIALAKSSRHSRGGSSRVYLSEDYGKTFQNITDRVFGSSQPIGIVDKYYNSDLVNSHYVFTDLERKCIMTTRDYAKTFIHRCDLPFTPRTVSISSHTVNHILAYDEEAPNSPVYVSTNFGVSWRLMRENVKSFFWGVIPYDSANTVYVEEKRGSRGNAVLRSDQYFTQRIHESIIEDVEDFEIKEEYMFATKKQHLLGSPQNETLQFWVSYKRRDFVNAHFPNFHMHSDYYVADASENQVILCVVHNTSDTNLYVSNREGTNYSLSLERIVYFNPEGAFKDTWLSIHYDQSFADIHKVKGLRGIYIASQLIASHGAFTLQNQRSLITFDKGGEWSLLSAPTVMHGQPNRNCSKKIPMQHWSKAQLNNCSLHLSQEFTRLYPGSQTQPIMSLESAPGLIMASGAVGNSLKNQQDMFVSHDAGYTWYQVMEGNYMFSMADHGGVMLAARQFQPTDSVYYSKDEGISWHVYKFTNQSAVRLYGILTEPGEKTTIFSLFGSKPDHHSWILFQLDMRGMLPRTCSSYDYKQWSLPDAYPDKGCLLGQKLVIQRRVANSSCYNGRNFVRSRVMKNCTCSRDDFECDFGYRLNGSMECVENEIFHGLVQRIPNPCPPGTLYPYTRGYRQVSGDACSGGDEHKYAPRMFFCPVRERSEFVLLAFWNRIQSFDLETMRLVTLYQLPSDLGVRITAVAFDYSKNQLFWSTSRISMIQTLSLNSTATDRSARTLAEIHTAEITSLAFDWTGDNLYWADPRASAIDMMHSNGYFRRRILSNHTMLVRPLHLVLDPIHGWMYWLDVSFKGNKVMRAWMSGDPKSVLVVTDHPLRSPQGLALDLVHEHLFFTLAGNHSLLRMELDGSNITQLPMYVETPGLLDVFKESIVWLNGENHQLMSSSLHSGNLALRNFPSNVVDMSVVSHISQSAKGACTPPTAPCSQLCTPQPHPMDDSKQNRTCKCGDGFIYEQHPTGNQQCGCEGNNEKIIDGFCQINNATNATCKPDQLMCANDRCLPKHWRCDGDDDCGDMSDETDCPFNTCPPSSFTCDTGKCIPHRWHCDFDSDCSTGEDERNCTYLNCSVDEFECTNKRCIDKNFVCDMDNDCRDMSDERNCTNPASCGSWEWTCDNGECVSFFTKCNGRPDCSDGSDENNCQSNTTTCTRAQFHCLTTGSCISLGWVCDGDNDCNDNSDEQNCTSTTSLITTPSGNTTCGSFDLTCRNGFCVSFLAICDGVDDCGDMSDEFFCEDISMTTVSLTCRSNQYTCSSGQCIDLHKRCDNHTRDCLDNSDEMDCNYGCAASHFECYDSVERECIWGSWLCDGDMDCPHGEDERNCNNATDMCPSSYFTCVIGEGCIPPAKRCDGHVDCGDHSDEKDCQVKCDGYTTKNACCQHGCNYLRCPEDSVEGCFTKDITVGSSCSAEHNNLCKNGSVTPSVNHDSRFYYHCPYNEQYISWMFVCNGEYNCNNHLGDENSCDPGLMSRSVTLSATGIMTTNSSIYVSWVPANSGYSFIVSYFPEGQPGQWANRTTKGFFNITNLTPVTTYVISVYPKYGQRIFYPSVPLRVTTNEGRPNPPRHLQVQTNLDDGIDSVSVTWQAPAHNYYILHYLVEMKDLGSRHLSYTKETGDLQVSFYKLVAGHSYNITVHSVNNAGFGSDLVTKKFQYKEDQLRPLEVTAGKATDNSVTLSWTARAGAKQYKVTAIIPYQEGRRITKTTKETSYTFTELCPSQAVDFTVEVEYEDDSASLPSSTIETTTTGESIPVPSIQNITIFTPITAAVTFNKNANQKVTLYYLEDSELDLEMFLQKAHRVSTTEPTLMLKNLTACDRYFFRVGSQFDTCPVSQALVRHTQEDDLAPPKRLQYKFVENAQVLLQWEAPCDSMIKDVGYMVTITWPGANSHSDLVPANNLTYLWKNTNRGVTYHFQVRTKVPFSHSSRDLAVAVPPYPPIEGFVLQLEPNFTVYMYWEAPEDKPPAHIFKGYNVTIWQGKTLVMSKIVASPPLMESLTTTGDYLVKISMAVSNGPDGEAFVFKFPYTTNTTNKQANNDDSVVKISKTNLAAILVPVCLVLVILAVVVMIFVVRHRRLQRSFLAFANSHYNTRSGTTTFSSDLDDDEPMIQGFSDDEPLVLA